MRLCYTLASLERTHMEEIGKILPAVLKKRIQQGGPGTLGLLAPFWPQVAGKPIAQHAQPVAFEAGTLTLTTDCPNWAAQLREMKEEIRAEINSFLGAPVVKKLRILDSGVWNRNGPDA